MAFWPPETDPAPAGPSARGGELRPPDGFLARGDELVLYVARQYSVVKDRTSP
jgi:hypothetical protein